MCIERYVRLVAGSFVLLSLVLAHLVSPWWYLLTAFVGANLLQSAFSRSCPMWWLLRRVGVPETAEKVAPSRAA